MLAHYFFVNSLTHNGLDYGIYSLIYIFFAELKNGLCLVSFKNHQKSSFNGIKVFGIWTFK